MGTGLIVVDTNVVSYFVIAGAHTQRAEAVRSRDVDWLVPGLFVHEWLNVVSKHVRLGLFDRDEALRVYRRGTSLVQIEASTPDPVAIFNLVKQSGCSSYDCEFVALVHAHRARLVTTDQELLAAFPDVTESLIQSK